MLALGMPYLVFNPVVGSIMMIIIILVIKRKKKIEGVVKR